MNSALVAVAIQQAPAVIALLRDAFVKKHPDEVAPSDEQVMAAYRNAFTSSIAKDENWLSAHPSDAPVVEQPEPAAADEHEAHEALTE